MASTIFTASGTYTAGTNKVLVEVYGGGGGGGTASVNGAGGGGGGAWVKTTGVVVVAGNNYTVVVGAAVAVANNGNNSYFTTTGVTPTSVAEGALAVGGAKGANGAAGGHGAGGNGGSTGASIGDLENAGGAGGGPSSGVQVNGGGGGEAGGPEGTGAAGGGGAAGGTGGSGTTSGGDGGVGAQGGTASAAGTAPGGGGGGASTLAVGNGGARGEVRITEINEINTSESASVSETVQVQLIHFVNKSESISVTESRTLLKEIYINKTETITSSESSYPGQVLADGATGYWKLNETSGNVADSSGNGFIGNASGTPLYSQTSAISSDNGAAIRFDNSADTFSVADNNLLDIGTGSFTWELWLKTTATSIGTIYRKFPGGAVGGGTLDINRTANKFGIRIVDVTGIVNVDLASTASINDGNFHHCVMVLDRSNDMMYVYVDGILSNSRSAALVAGQDLSNAGNISFNAPSGTFQDVTLDEIAVYQTALTANQVNTHYNLGIQAPQVLLVHQPTISDSVAVAESHKEHLVHLINQAESVLVTEAYQLMVQSYINKSESVSATESVNVIQVFNTSVSDSMNLSESVAMTLAWNASVSDSITVDEGIKILLISFVNINESITVTEAMGFTVVNNITVSDTVGGEAPPPIPTPSPYVLLDNGQIAVLVADISPYPLYQRL